MRVISTVVIATVIFCIVGSCSAQSDKDQDSVAVRALQEYRTGQYAAAERDCRELVKWNPSNILAQIYLGQALFKQSKYAEAIAPFEKARDLEASGLKLNYQQHHILLDQLVMWYGASGNLEKVHSLLDEAIREDPNYPLNYYDLACAYAEEGNKPKMLASLALAFQHKDHVLQGEQMPDPRTDDSFQSYVHDPDFIKLMEQIGYK